MSVLAHFKSYEIKAGTVMTIEEAERIHAEVERIHMIENIQKQIPKMNPMKNLPFWAPIITMLFLTYFDKDVTDNLYRRYQLALHYDNGIDLMLKRASEDMENRYSKCGDEGLTELERKIVDTYALPIVLDSMNREDISVFTVAATMKHPFTTITPKKIKEMEDIIMSKKTLL